MNKKVIIILILTLISFPVFSSGLGLVFNVNYNIGNSDFFEKSERLFQSDGNNYLESIKNKLGMGFNAGVIIPVTPKLSVIPSFTVNFGHQVYELQMLEGISDADKSENYSLFIFSGELKANYDLIVLNNGWRVTLLFGANYNSFTADDEAGIEDITYWGAEAGIGVKFFQVENFGFQTFLIYKYPFSEENFRYLVRDSNTLCLKKDSITGCVGNSQSDKHVAESGFPS